MNKFLSEIAQYLYKNTSYLNLDTTLVFPNRRAGLFFQKYLSSLVEHPIFSPEIITISDLVTRFAKLKPIDSVSGVIQLYNVYCEVTGSNETLDDFFFWGEMLLSDFNDIDKYTVDADKLFQNIESLKEIDAGFDFLTDDQRQFLSSFWENLIASRASNDKLVFLEFWKRLSPIYNAFNQRLETMGLASEGMVYRKAAQRTTEPNFNADSRNYVFIGFNALNACEKKLFKFLKVNNNALFFWDYDTYYMSRSHHEANMFMIENLKSFPMPDDFMPDFSNFENVHSIQAVAVPGFMGQASFAGQWLQENHKLEDEKFDHTAVVLCDENLLLPVINSVPDSVETMNVTMGYPLKDSPVFSLIKALIDLDRNARVSPDGLTFYFRTVLNVLNHSLLKPHLAELLAELELQIKRMNRIYLKAEDFGGNDLARLVFNLPHGAEGCKTYLQDLLIALFECVSSDDAIVKECIYQCHLALARLDGIFDTATAEQQISKKLYYQVLLRSLERLSIPFEGEPLSGLQIMGFLETRCLDFDRLVLLSVNDTRLPGTSSGHSFIPYSLRRGFGLPLLEQRNAMYAYYFYRLLQRAKEVVLVYDSRTEALGGGEVSRYVTQLKYEATFTKIQFVQGKFSFSPLPEKNIEVIKDEQIYNALVEFMTRASGPISPSALSTYLDCSLRFYFRYIEKVHESDEVAEEIDQMMFGRIAHKALEEIYGTKVGRTVDKAWIDSVLKNELLLNKCLGKALQEEYFKGGTADISGKNLLVYDIIKKYLLKILKYDRSIAPFQLISLEKQYETTVDVVLSEVKTIAVRIGGVVDRLDELNGSIRVVDYKTGKTDGDVGKLEALFKQGDAKNKPAFQTLLYSMAVEHSLPDFTTVKPAVYGARAVFQDSFSPLFRFGGDDLTFNVVKPEFEELLGKLLADIFDANLPFTQVVNVQKCSFCPYRTICNR